MFCSNCGSKNSNNATICSFCGESLTENIISDYTNLNDSGDVNHINAALNNNSRLVMCEIAFWTSFLSLIFSICTRFETIPLVIFNIIFAVRGLKTKKKKKAVTTIIIASISMCIWTALFIVCMMYVGYRLSSIN